MAVSKQTERQLRALGYGLEGKYLEVRTFGRYAESFWLNGNMDDLPAWLEKKAADGCDIGMGVNPRDRKDGSNASITTFTAVFADLDLNGEGVEEAEEELKGVELRPSMVVRSGGGLHAYWLIEPTTDMGLWRKAMAGVQERLEHLKADRKVKDPARLLRLVPFVNQKRGLATELRWLDDTRYRLEDVAEQFPAKDAEQPPRVKERKCRRPARNEPSLSVDSPAEVLDQAIVSAEEGNRHTLGISLCKRLSALGCSVDETKDSMRQYQEAVNRGGDSTEYTWDEALRTLQWVYGSPDYIRDTDVGNAELFVKLHRHRVRCCAGRWLIWNGAFWEWDETDAIYEFAKEVARHWRQKAKSAKDDDERDRHRKSARRTESKRALDAMLFLGAADPDIRVKTEQLDSHAFLFNAGGLTIDLRAGVAMQPSPDHLMTTTSQVQFEPGADCRRWKSFLKEVIVGEDGAADEATIRFLQKAAGYSMTGSIKEEVLFFLCGFGGNGKGTFIETIRMALGDYSTEIGFSSLLTGRKANPDDRCLPRLRGARFVSASEPEDGQQFAVGKLKSLTGGDRLTARYLYKEEFEFNPEFKLWLQGNTKPTPGKDDGFWRRMILVPFRRRFAGQDKDTHLKGKDGILARELPGILNWMIEGCILWQREGLESPANIRTANQDYRNESDVVRLFLHELYEDASAERALLKDIHQEFMAWAHRNGEKAMSSRALGKTLDERGYRKARSGDIFITGLRRKADLASSEVA